MVQRLCSFLVVLLLMFQGRIFAQEKNNPDTISCWVTPVCQKMYSQQTCLDSILKKIPVVNLKELLSPSYYASHLGFFCKKELQLDKVTIIPLRFRLGSLDYVNYLEQKPNVIRAR